MLLYILHFIFNDVLSVILDLIRWALYTLRALVLMMKSKTITTRRFKTIPHLNIQYIHITKDISLLTNKKKTDCTITDFRLNPEEEKPLVILACWMYARTRHKYNFAEFWIEKGFDVLTITISAWDLLWPIMGSQIVAKHVVKFLESNRSYSKIIVHGFSISGYQWGEVLVKMSRNSDKYQQILDKIVGQIWDSIADIEDLPTAVPIAVFPKKKFLATALYRYLWFHMKIFYKISTRHYLKARQFFHSKMVEAPALIFVSKTDPIGNVSTNHRLMEVWETEGIKVYWKVFEKSPHVGHFIQHREEYIGEIDRFLDDLNMNQHTQMQIESEEPTRKIYYEL